MTAFSFQASAGKLVECDSEFDVLACEGALGVRGEDARHLVPSDVDVGVMIGDLGGGADPNDEAQSLVEVAELKRSADRLAVACPCVMIGEERFNLIV